MALSREPLARDALLAGSVSQTVVEQVILGTRVPQAGSRKNVIPEGKCKVQSMLLGLYSYGGRVGISRHTKKLPQTTRLLVAFAQQAWPGFLFTSIQVNLDYSARPHVDRNNLGASLITGIGPYRDGKLWVEDQAGNDVYTLKGSVSKHYCVGKKIRGFKVDVKGAFFEFDGNKLHFALPFHGIRCTLVYFVSDNYAQASPEVRIELGNAGFSFLWCSPQLTLMKSRKEGEGEIALIKKARRVHLKANTVRSNRVVLLRESSKAIEGKDAIVHQAIIILKTLRALGGESTVEKLCSSFKKNGLETVQTPERIFGFYRNELINRRYIAVQLKVKSQASVRDSMDSAKEKMKKNKVIKAQLKIGAARPKRVVLLKRSSRAIEGKDGLANQAIVILKALRALFRSHRPFPSTFRHS